MEKSLKAMEERIALMKSKALRDDADVVAIAIVYMNRLVIPLCRLHFMVILRQRFSSFNELLFTLCYFVNRGLLIV